MNNHDDDARHSESASDEGFAPAADAQPERAQALHELELAVSGGPAWHDLFELGLPRNAATGKHYRGHNMGFLADTMAKQGWEQPLFLTLRQSNQLGGHVLPGSHATTITWLARRGRVQHHNVFNIAQTSLALDDLEIPLPQPGQGTPADVLAEVVLEHFRAHIKHFAAESQYYPQHDQIFLTDREDFESLEAYYSTAFRLLTHWASMPGRLRLAVVPDADDGTEWLAAELGALLLCRAVGLDYVWCDGLDAARLVEAGPQVRSRAMHKARRAFDDLAGRLGLPGWDAGDEAADEGEDTDARSELMMDLAMATHDVCELWLESAERDIELDAEHLMLDLEHLRECWATAVEHGWLAAECAGMVQSQRRYSLGDDEPECIDSIDNDLFCVHGE